ncbi:MAG: hypothetical protein CVU90_12425 [Firmicutes bacterium HGW-Firmicutes-15]|nr:MAG: hypothetical protein CVU90_12425 [Firmicutes bacterium HGW-Firmicutes-15]
MSAITSVIPREDYRLEVLMENGSSVILNLADRLNTVRFGMLADQEYFQRVITDGTVVRWGNLLEISASEIFQLAQK